MNKPYFILILFFFLSCKSQEQSKVLSGLVNNFQDEVFDSYPLKFDTLIKPTDPELALFPASYYASRFTGYFLVKDLKAENFQEWKKKIKQHEEIEKKKVISVPFGNNESTNSNDDKSLYVPDYTSPFLEDIKSFSDTINSTIIFRSEEGMFFKEKYQEELLPEIKKHGYSQGVSINDNKKIAIFWVIAW